MRHAALIPHLHRVFDLYPDPVLVLRVRADPDDLAWSVVRDTLTLTPAGGDPVVFDLAALTLTELADAIQAEGFTLAYESEDHGHLLAASLMEGAGTAFASNGDHLFLTTNPILFLLDSLGVLLEATHADLLLALAEMAPLAADGEWADLWGHHLGTQRRDGELDAAYTQRIFFEILRPRNNRFALEATLTEIAEAPVSVFEPWTRVLHGSGYAPGLSRDRLRDSWYWTHGIIEVSGADRSAVQAMTDRHRAAGVLPRYRQTLEVAEVDASGVSVESACQHWSASVPDGAVLNLWLDGALPADSAPIGNEPWSWVVTDTVRGHRSLYAPGRAHDHGVVDVPTFTVPAGHVLWAWVYLDPDFDTAANPIMLGWRINDAWVYAYWGSDLRSETPRFYQGALPQLGSWVLLSVDPGSLGIAPGDVCDGLWFGLVGARASWGPSGTALVMESSGSTYQISGIQVFDLYEADGTYHYGPDVLADLGVPIYRLNPPADTDQLDPFLAGQHWRLGDLVNLGYLAGTPNPTASLAIWGHLFSLARTEIIQYWS